MGGAEGLPAGVRESPTQNSLGARRQSPSPNRFVKNHLFLAVPDSEEVSQHLDTARSPRALCPLFSGQISYILGVFTLDRGWIILAKMST